MTAKPKTHRPTPKTKESIRYPTVPQNQTDRDKKTCAESAFVCKKVEKCLTHLRTAKPPSHWKVEQAKTGFFLIKNEIIVLEVYVDLVDVTKDQ